MEPSKELTILEKIYHETFTPGKTYILGISGGPDSLFLLHTLLHFNKTITTPLNLVVAHVNYGLRGKESDTDSNFVKETAQKFHLPVEIKKISHLPSGNLEEVCRELRYEFFQNLRKKYQAQGIIVAHHLNDQAETILLNLTRGSFLTGLGGMNPLSPKRKIYRPLLSITKETILKYLHEHNLPYRIDETNAHLYLARNLIREKIVPELQTINENFLITLGKNAENIRELNQFLESYVEQWMKENTKEQGLDYQKFIEAPIALQKLLLAKLYKNIYGNSKNFSSTHLEKILATLKQGKSGNKKEFGAKFFIKIMKSQHQIREIIIEPIKH